MQSIEYLPFIILLAFGLYTLKRFELFDLFRIAFLSREKRWKFKNFFSKHFNYFNQLSDKEKDIFIVRAYRLINSIKIIGRKDFEVTINEKLYVIAAYIQLTFGFKYYKLPKFHTILVYPDAFRNQFTGNMHYGEVNAKGIIVLSWKRLVKGFAIPDDKINLGLHEMAHALMHTIIYSDDHEYGLDPFLRDIVRLSKIEMEKIRSDNYHFFRKYAGTNIYEFFAIAVEYFFEVPKEFKNELPTLYQFMVKLLKQEPA
ncbi:zinc-dependent peptidase [Bacteroidota bacterium]